MGQPQKSKKNTRGLKQGKQVAAVNPLLVTGAHIPVGKITVIKSGGNPPN